MNKSKPVSIHKKVLVLWSGGLDSTALICQYLSDGYHVTALPVALSNSYDKVKRETAARRSMVNDYFINYNFTLMSPVEVNVGRVGGMVFAQAPVWLSTAVWSLGENFDEVAIAYVNGDSAIPFIKDFKKLWKAHAFLFERTCIALPPLKFPFAKRTKPMIYNELPAVLRKHITWCEEPNGLKDMCGHCKPCRTMAFHDLVDDVKKERSSHFAGKIYESINLRY